MSTPNAESLRAHLETLVALARILERVERGNPAVTADQYRDLVRRLQSALAQPMPEAALQSVLGAHPAAAQVYENMHYEQSGLSLSPLERSVATEMMASQELARIARIRRSGPGR